MVQKILLIEDDNTLSVYLADLLRKAGYHIDQCFDGERGLEVARTQQHHLILLDKMLPKLDGVTLLQKLRESSQQPVIMVSAKGAEEERIVGLSHGADDYVAKPFNATELLLRIERLLKRSHGNTAPITQSEITVDGLRLALQTQSITLHGEPLDFTPIQFKLLWALMSQQNTIVPKADLYLSVLNKKLGAYDRSLDMHLSRVRRKLNDANWYGERLQTVHGQGYCFK
ncbi:MULTISPECIES: response regulator transcription factor [Pseudoalteromonas]|uniref:Response regulator n=1 Tax=Pseudoalteromonas rubra TaxID=43658 RepID=A0A5S3UYF1_9GAMM|nr:response regulator transcription factor [Pseudoalteromonas rubra]MCG7560215.1 response regulator transcription factor [Pseudoalteromonas sp. McH1-42]MEC4088847.1 response regulator transcription factor [Pseudoalteromonas rubra]QPB85388.1 response regulator [Pseudoalteromonas rubra]